MLFNETYSICISQEVCLHILGFLEGNTDKLKTVCNSAGDSMSPETSEAIAGIFYETWNLFFPQILIGGMQCDLLELLDNKGSMLVKRERVDIFFNNNKYIFSLITDNIIAIYISGTLGKSMKEVRKMYESLSRKACGDESILHEESTDQNSYGKNILMNKPICTIQLKNCLKLIVCSCLLFCSLILLRTT